MAKRLIKTDRIHLVFALYAIKKSLPTTGTLEDWCLVAESAFNQIGFPTYAHKSAQVSLYQHSLQYRERDRHDRATYHCDLQHDVSKLNRDTDDPSGVNTDPLFPNSDMWVFYNDGGTVQKGISITQLEKCYRAYSHIKLESRFMIASDGHKCLSAPELLIEETGGPGCLDSLAA